VKSPSVYVLDEAGTTTAELAMEGRTLGTTAPSYTGGGDFIQNDD
jgi:hypothetical protein